MTRRGKIFTAIGLLLLLAALCLTAYNLMTDAMASMQVQVTLEALKPELGEAEASEAVSVQPVRETALEEIPDYLLNPQMDMPVKTVDGADYIGLLSLPAISLELPVIDQWSYESLRLAPCRYSGSAYTHNLVILGHNYAGHFRELKKLQPGDAVTFTDMDGNVFSCEVMALENPYAHGGGGNDRRRLGSDAFHLHSGRHHAPCRPLRSARCASRALCGRITASRLPDFVRQAAFLQFLN